MIIGAPTAPVPEAMATYATMLAASRSADDVHLYGIDLLGRSLQGIEALPHTGAVAVRNDALALRIMRHISGIAAQRRALLGESGAGNIWEHAAAGNPLPPQIVLFVSGTDRLLTTDSPHLQLTPVLNSLITDSVGVRIQIVLGGLPKIVHHRLGMNIERRIVLGLSDSSDYGAIGVPKAFTRELAVDRRAVDLPSGRLTQLARLAPPDQSEGDAIRRIGASLGPGSSSPPHLLACSPTSRGHCRSRELTPTPPDRRTGSSHRSRSASSSIQGSGRGSTRSTICHSCRSPVPPRAADRRRSPSCRPLRELAVGTS